MVLLSSVNTMEADFDTQTTSPYPCAVSVQCGAVSVQCGAVGVVATGISMCVDELAVLIDVSCWMFLI